MGCLEFLCLDVKSPFEGALVGSGSSAVWVTSLSLPVCSHIFSGDLLTAFLLLEEQLKGQKTSQVCLSGRSQPYTGNTTCYCLLSAVASVLRGFLASQETQRWRRLCHPDYRLVCSANRGPLFWLPVGACPPAGSSWWLPPRHVLGVGE